jgi:hypothetical protein
MKKFLLLASLLFLTNFLATARICQCNLIDYYGSAQANMTITYNSFGNICDPCGASNMTLVIHVFIPGQNDDIIYSGSPSLYGINFLCGSQCTEWDWLITRKTVN